MERVSALIQGDMLAVEARFRKNLASDVPLIGQVGEYLLSSGGKRIRPMLLLLAAKLCDYTGDYHIELAGVIEFIHSATLLHDDVVDGAELRRGNRSANAVWGNEASVLVGDFLFAKSFSVMVGCKSLKILQLLSDTTTQMAEGEVQQLLNTADLEVNEKRYLEVIRDKTAILIAAACQVGAVLAEASPEREDALREFGFEIGIAFQLMDDALDYVADQKEFGKTRGHDLEEGKMTLPLIRTYALVDEAERAEIKRVIELDDLSDRDLERVCELIEAHNGIEYTRMRAVERIQLAKSHLEIFPQSEVRDALFDLADYVVARSK
ncbi:polyprenyl synthetase family protein [Geopsychrobacter electrodiphilus]|uniref:polyprenyl synthetase family protein n=1 Tax=Geopsychrobacter electrodiphilus TaxID=225196 RepID=UPI000382A279|nr:polyprenyl synthetase family protein [Geopsychrobacter electrodiphilus]